MPQNDNNTEVYSKKEFIEMLETAIPDDYIVVMSRTLTGTIVYSEKKNRLTIPFAFAANTFENADARTARLPSMSLLFCEEHDLSPEAKNLLHQPIN